MRFVKSGDKARLPRLRFYAEGPKMPFEKSSRSGRVDDRCFT